MITSLAKMERGNSPLKMTPAGEEALMGLPECQVLACVRSLRDASDCLLKWAESVEYRLERMALL
jgi:hypothetical protein